MNTLSDFLTQAKCQFRVYDLGRLVQKINNTDFQKVTQAQTPYPYPIQQQAFFAITFWQLTRQKEHFVWFLKMPLDEQGLMKITAQTSFIRMVVEAMGEDVTATMNDKLQERLASNPFVFKPNTEKLAIFNAAINQHFVRPASAFYAPTQQYFSAQTEWEDWQRLGLQGFADLAARIDHDNNQQYIINALDSLPEQPLQTLALCLENQHNLSTEFVEQLALQASKRLQQGQQATAILLLRAMASAKAQGVAKQLILSQLSSDLVHQADWYIAVAGRCWSLLEDESLLNRYFEALANHQLTLFPQLFADLVAIPALRDNVLKQLRLTARSPALSNAIGLLFAEVKSPATDASKEN